LLGGTPTPGIGFGSGVERIILELKKQGIPPPPEEKPQAFVAYLGKTRELKDAAIAITAQLRHAGIKTEMSYGDRSAKAQMKQANASGAAYAVILGENELANDTVSIKNLQATGMETEQKQVEIARTALVGYLSRNEI
jgi:histidyl-tRNA synthetase